MRIGEMWRKRIEFTIPGTTEFQLPNTLLIVDSYDDPQLGRTNYICLESDERRWLKSNKSSWLVTELRNFYDLVSFSSDAG